MTYSIAQNTSFLTAASLFQKLISSVYFFILAKYIGEEVTGDYFNIFASIAIFTVIADFGLGGVLIREVAKNKDRVQEYVSTIFIIKLFCSLCAIILMFLCKFLFNYPVQGYGIISIAAVILFFDSLQNIFYGIFRAFHNVLYEAVGLIIAQIITLLIGISALYMNAPLIWLVVAFAIPSIMSVCYASLSLYLRYHVRFSFLLNKNLIIKILYIAFPFALSGFLVRLYAYSDSVIMNHYLSRAELGWWGMAYKITYVFQLLPVALGASLYPVLSNLFENNKQKIQLLILRSYHYLLLLAFPIMIGIITIAPYVIPIFLPRFIPSIPALQILILSIGSGFLTFIHGAVLNASGKQSVQTALIFLALTISVIMNIILIPRFGIVGAAISAVVSNMVWCITGYIITNKVINLPHLKIFLLTQKLFWPAMLMGGAVYLLIKILPIPIVVVLGVFIYVLFLFLTGGLTKELYQEFKIKIQGGLKD